MHFVAILTTILTTQTPPAEPFKFPEPFQTTLMELKLPLKDEPNFKAITYTIGDTARTQVVRIRKAPETFLSLTNFEAYGLFYESETEPSLELLKTFAQKQYTLGDVIYELPSADQKYYRFRFRMTIPVDIQKDKLKYMLDSCGVTADLLEIEFNPGAKDVF